MKKLLKIFTVLIVLSSLTSCSKDDDAQDPIIGGWELELMRTIYENGEIDEESFSDSDTFIIQFKTDGTFLSEWVEGAFEGQVSSGVWERTSNSQYSISYYDEENNLEDDVDLFTTRFLNGNKMIMRFEDYDEPDMITISEFEFTKTNYNIEL